MGYDHRVSGSKPTPDERARWSEDEVLEALTAGLVAARPAAETAFKTPPPQPGIVIDCLVDICGDPLMTVAFRDQGGTHVVTLCQDVDLFSGGIRIYGRGGIAGLEASTVFETAVEFLSMFWATSFGAVRTGFIRGIDDPPLGASLTESKRCWSLHEGVWTIDPRW